MLVDDLRGVTNRGGGVRILRELFDQEGQRSDCPRGKAVALAESGETRVDGAAVLTHRRSPSIARSRSMKTAYRSCICRNRDAAWPSTSSSICCSSRGS